MAVQDEVDEVVVRECQRQNQRSIFNCFHRLFRRRRCFWGILDDLSLWWLVSHTRRCRPRTGWRSENEWDRFEQRRKIERHTPLCFLDSERRPCFDDVRINPSYFFFPVTSSCSIIKIPKLKKYDIFNQCGCGGVSSRRDGVGASSAVGSGSSRRRLFGVVILEFLRNFAAFYRSFLLSDL